MGIPPERVLVADSLPDSADSLAALLEGYGIPAFAAYDGLKALELADAWKPDAAVLEIDLPGISGVDLARRLRQKYRAIRLVAYTSWAVPVDRKDALEAGFDHFLLKPSQPELLLSSMGVETGLLVQRSIDLQVAQVRRQIELVGSLLTRAETFARQRWSICDFVERSIDMRQVAITRMPIPHATREELAGELGLLSRRVALLRSMHGPSSLQ